ncbi:MAG: hypothetical protein KDA78_13750, partial [Planctomycetaceae bacterium]|nr:hypothetical protein [Planctomycetaceae bacterium]
DALALLGDDSVERLALLLEIHQRNSANEVFQAELPTRTEAAKAEAETLLPLQLEEEQLSRLYGNSSQELRSVRERIAAVKLFLDQQRNQLRKLEDSSPQSPLEYSEAYLQILKNDLITLQERSQQLEEIALKEEQRAQSVAAFEVQEQTMKSALERKSELYKILLKNLGDMNLIKDFSTYNTRVMSRIKPGEKIWPKSRFSLPAGLFLGAVVGMGLALTREVRDRRFHSPNEVESTLGLNVIAQLPPASPLLGKLSLLTAPQSPEAEAIRSIRTTLLNRRRHDLHAKTVGIMSMQSDDVTARVAANVALSLAQVSPRVLLIESNFHSPMLQGIFQLPQSRTLNDLMAGQVSLAETIHRVQQGLHVIVANRDEQLANDVFADGRFEKQIQSLRAHYDWILLSTPAAASSNDLLSIGQLFDLGLFMLIADQEDSVRDVQLMRRLRELNIPVDYAVIQQVHDNLFSGR